MTEGVERRVDTEDCGVAVVTECTDILDDGVGPGVVLLSLRNGHRGSIDLRYFCVMDLLFFLVSTIMCGFGLQ